MGEGRGSGKRAGPQWHRAECGPGGVGVAREGSGRGQAGVWSPAEGSRWKLGRRRVEGRSHRGRGVSGRGLGGCGQGLRDVAWEAVAEKHVARDLGTWLWTLWIVGQRGGVGGRRRACAETEGVMI